jgi:hypothetical protein
MQEIHKTAEDIRCTISELRELLKEIDPTAKLVANGVINYPDLGMRIVYGAEASSCHGCFGCIGCDGGCQGCRGTSTVATLKFKAEDTSSSPVGAG